MPHKPDTRGLWVDLQGVEFLFDTRALVRVVKEPPLHRIARKEGPLRYVSNIKGNYAVVFEYWLARPEIIGPVYSLLLPYHSLSAADLSYGLEYSWRGQTLLLPVTRVLSLESTRGSVSERANEAAAHRLQGEENQPRASVDPVVWFDQIKEIGQVGA